MISGERLQGKGQHLGTDQLDSCDRRFKHMAHRSLSWDVAQSWSFHPHLPLRERALSHRPAGEAKTYRLVDHACRALITSND